MSTMTLAPRTAPTSIRREVARDATARPGAVRLTRRGRFVVLALACAVVGAVVVMFAAGSAATDAPAGPVSVEVLTVAPGETLWGIAGDVADDLGVSVGEAMERIEQMNAIDSGALAAGEELRIPTR